MCIWVIYYCYTGTLYSRFEKTRRLSVAETCPERTMIETPLHTRCIPTQYTHTHTHTSRLPDLCHFKRFAVRLTYLKTREKTRSRFLFLFLLEKDFSRTFRLWTRCTIFHQILFHSPKQFFFLSSEIVFFWNFQRTYIDRTIYYI